MNKTTAQRKQRAKQQFVRGHVAFSAGAAASKKRHEERAAHAHIAGDDADIAAYLARRKAQTA